jgi:hypothetical protein
MAGGRDMDAKRTGINQIFPPLLIPPLGFPNPHDEKELR